MQEALQIDGRSVRLSTLDRVLWPATGTVKAELVDYYVKVADALLPHIAGHPVTLHRFPAGVEGPHFFQTRCPPHPSWITTTRLSYARTGKSFDVAVLNDRASLVWAANLSAIEIHPYLSPADDFSHPRWMVADLDPGPPAGPALAAQVALLVRERLDALRLPLAVKTSGGKGLHVYAKVPEGTTYDASKALAHDLATELAHEHPQQVTATMTRAHRPGRVFVDWSQNDAGKSTVAPYSLRGYAEPSVSTPVTWDEVEALAAGGAPHLLPVRPRDALARIERYGDLFAAMLRHE